MICRFVGSDTFCFKACFNNQTEPDYCQNVYDLVGCQYNMPSNVTNGTYTSCEGDLQDVVGVYTTDGTGKVLFRLLVALVVTILFFLVSTWSMPQTLLSPPPYQPRIPASSNCVTYDPSSLYVFPSTVSFFFFFFFLFLLLNTKLSFCYRRVLYFHFFFLT